MADIDITIDLDDLTDVSRQDVLDFLSVHSDELHDEDWEDFLEESQKEEIALNVLRGAPSEEVTAMLEASGYPENVLDNTSSKELMTMLLKRYCPTPIEPDTDSLLRAFSLRLEALIKDYQAACVVRDMKRKDAAA